MNKIRSINPATGETLKEFDVMPPAQIDEIIAKADKTYKNWKKTPLLKRAALLYKLAQVFRENREEMAGYVTAEMGMLYGESLGDIEYCACIFDYYAERGERFLADQPLDTPFGKAYNTFEPIGVILSVQPWNFPYSQAVRSLAPAIMAGNAVVLKHASNVPQSALALEKAFERANAPAGLYANIFLPGAETSALVADKRIAGVALTGSAPAGSSLAGMAGKHIKPATLELGGNDAFIVLEDADIDAAVEHAVFGRLYNAGQVCTAPKRIILVKNIAGEFTAKAKAICESIVIGDPMNEKTILQPLSTENALNRVLRQLDDNIKAGGNLIYGGKRLDRPGWFMEPALVSGMRAGMPAFQEEVFGPVIFIYEVENEAEAIELANDSCYGLGGSVFSKNEARAEKVARQLETGMVYINHVTGTSPELPFNGTKCSGLGRELSPDGIYSFVNKKLIRVTSPDKPY